MENKTCTKCNINKQISDFYFRKDNNKYRNCCISCEKLRISEYYKDNTEDRKQYASSYYDNNKEKVAKVNKKNKDKNKDKNKEYQKIYRQNNSEKLSEQGKMYREKNKEQLNKSHLIRHKNRLKSDPLYKLKCDIRTSIVKSFKRNSFRKQTKTNMILGCSFEEFKIHIESQFEPWMNWQNHRKYSKKIRRWQLDHKIPISSASTEDDIIKLNHYTNFQPLCAEENLYKSNNF